MEPQTSQSNEGTLEFIHINDKCLYKIFEYLSASDLCSTSFTCKRLQTLTRDYFGQQYPNEWITIDINFNARGITELGFSKSDANKILKYFGKSIRNVRMQNPMNGRGWIDLGLLYNFLYNECCRELHSIELNLGCGIDLNSIAEDAIKIQFRSVQNVEIIDVDCVQSTYNGLLKLCVNLKKLEILTPADNVYDWLQYRYPNLKILSLPWIHDGVPPSIHHFLQNHQQLKDITCEGIHLRNPRFQNFENIHRLVFRVSCLDELINIIQQLKTNHANKMITFFGVELGICYGNIRSIVSDLNGIQSINKLEYDATWRSFEIPYLEHLHELNVNRIFEYPDVNQEQAPNLKSLELSYISDFQKSRMKGSEVMMISVPKLRSLLHLNKFSFVFKDIAAYAILSQRDLDFLEWIRRSVRGASNVDFHFYFDGKLNEDLPPNLTSSGNKITVNYHSRHDLHKSDDLFEYTVAEIIFE